MKNSVVKIFFYVSVASVIAILCFFIVYNAEWLVGDDAIIISQTGWGHAINVSNTVSPSTGRFFPFAYVVYDVLWLLGLTSVESHFALVAISFACSSLILLILGLKAVNIRASILRYIIVFAIVLIGVQRIYANHLDLYSCAWFGYMIILLWCLCCYYVHVQKSAFAATIGFLSISFLCYCSENMFVFPLCYGTVGLLFSWKDTSKLEKIYLWSMIGAAVLFLILYFVLIFPHIETAYSGDHGTNISFLDNAIKQFVAQKVLWMGTVVFGIRCYKIMVNKEKYEFWDTIILTGFGYCVGCAILKLNWTLYYSSAAIFILPAIAHYCVDYIGDKFTAIILICLAIFMCRKMPQTIAVNQHARLNTTLMMNLMEEEYYNGETFYWYEPKDNRPWCYELEMRRFMKSSLQTQIGWTIKVESFFFESIEQYNGKCGIYVLPVENQILFPNCNDSIISNNQNIWSDKSLTIIKVN